MRIIAFLKIRTHGTWTPWLMLSILLATAALAFVAQAGKQEKEIALAVTFTHLSDNLILIDEPRPVVRVRVTAAPADLEAMEGGNAACHIDLAGIGAGAHVLPVQPSDVTLPPNVSISALLTPVLPVRLAPAVRKSVAITAVMEGSPASGYAVRSVILKPDHVVLKGTTDMICGIDRVQTRPIDVSDISESFKIETALDLSGSIQVEPPLRIVVATVTMGKHIVTRELETIPTLTASPPVKVVMHPETIRLTVSGPETMVNRIETHPDFGVSIDLSGFGPGTHQLQATINLPVQTTLIDVKPEHFSVTIGN